MRLLVAIVLVVIFGFVLFLLVCVICACLLSGDADRDAQEIIENKKESAKQSEESEAAKTALEKEKGKKA